MPCAFHHMCGWLLCPRQCFLQSGFPLPNHSSLPLGHLPLWGRLVQKALSSHEHNVQTGKFALRGWDVSAVLPPL